MKKTFLIGWKDVKLAFRDKAGLLMMLLAPFLLTLGLGFVTGRFSGGNSSGISDIRVVLVDQDGGQLGSALVSVFKSTELAGLVKPSEISDPIAARQLVDNNQAEAVVIIPAGFTDSIFGDKTPVKLELYANPTTPTSVGVVKTILDDYLSRVEVGRVGGQVAVTQLLGKGLIQPQDAPAIGAKIGEQSASISSGSPSITIKSVTNNGKAMHFDILAFMAPGMALMFLMYTASMGGRSLLAERNQGTLARLMTSPTGRTEILGGKIFGTFLTGVAQIYILVEGSSLIFHLEWGDPLGVEVLILAAVFAATAWGMVITSIAKTPSQVGTMGSAIMLTFGILSGAFISADGLPGWLQTLRLITPNAWGLDGFNTLALGGTLMDILPMLGALVAMGIILFLIALVLFNRKGTLQP